MRRRAFLACLPALIPSLSRAQTWPSRPIRLLVGFPPGGTTDIFARLLQQPVGAALTQPVVVENRPGAGGITSTAELVQSAPDGHTLAFIVSTHASARALYRSLPFDPITDVAPVALVGTLPLALVVAAASPFRSLGDLVEAARRRPGQLNYATPGIGLAQHFAGELLKQRAGIDLVHVPYRGAGPAMNDLVGNQIETGFVAVPAALPFLATHRLRALAVTGATRAESLPDVPTIAELGFPGFVITEWYGVVAPARTPEAVVQRLNDVIRTALAAPDIVRWAQQNAVALGDMLPAAFASFVATEVGKLATIANQAGLRAE